MHISEADVRRNCYLHEAGHAIVALELGLVVSEIHCDGQIGYCKADPSTADQAAANAVLQLHQPVDTAAALEHVLDAYFGYLTTLLGGIAGESLELGLPIFATRRAADDFSSFFGFMAAMSRRIPLQFSDPVWLATYAKAQDEAWRIVSDRETHVRNVAAELEQISTISGDELLKLVWRPLR
jgi:hypothetical protein